MSQLLEVSLAECLEVKDAALDEAELWAILIQTLERIDALFTEVSTTRLNELLPVTPETIFLCPNGQTDLASAFTKSRFYEDCLPPEFLNNVSLNDDQLQKMFIYSLGMSVYSAADYNLTSEQDLNISSELDEFLSSMCTKNPKNRINLDSALKVCSGNFMSITPILDLYRMVLGQMDVEMHPVEEKTYDYSYEVFKANKIPSKSQVPSEASTIHYILLDRGPNARSSARSFDTFDGRSKVNDNKFEENLVPSEADIEETFMRLNNRRRRLESLRKGLRKLENDDLSEASVNLSRLSTLGLLPENQSTFNSTRMESQQTMNFLSSEYEWLDRRAREIDDWRKNHLKTKEMIITPDPIIREADVRQKHEDPQTSSEVEIQRFREFEFPSEGLNYAPIQSSEVEPSVKPDVSKWNISNDAKQNAKSSVKVDEEVQTKAIDPVNKLETNQVMVGPEFRLTYPTANLTVREASLISESNVRHAKVHLLNGSEVDVLCCPTNTGQQIYECIVAFLQLKEPHFFGLAVPKDEELVFLNKELELRKVAPLDWTSKKKFRSRTASYLFLDFCIQYFVPSTNFLMYGSTLHSFYLQLRQHVLSERLQINDIQGNFLLAALALKAEYGPNDVNEQHFSIGDYLPQTMIRKSGEAACKASVLGKWRGMSAIPQRDAERIFVEKCMTSREYGYHFYRLSKVNNTPNNTWIGIGIPGIVIGRDLEEMRVLEASHQWSNTLKVSYNRHRFSISNNNNKFNYYTETFRKCRYLLWLACDQHCFKTIQMVPLGRNEAGIIYDVPRKDLLGRQSGPQNTSVHELQKQKAAISSIGKVNQEPLASVAKDDEIQLNTQNKLLKYLQEKPKIDLPSFNFDDILENNSDPSQEAVVEDGLRKPRERPRNDPQNVGEVDNEKSQLHTQKKLLNYLQDKSQVDLPTFKLANDVNNLPNSTSTLNDSALQEGPIKPKRFPNQDISTNKETIPSKSSLEKANDTTNISPPPAFKVSNNSNSFNQKPPAKSPRILNDFQSKGSLPPSLPSVVINDFSSQSEASIPNLSGVKLNPLYQEEDAVANGSMDSNTTPVPALRSSLLKEPFVDQKGNPISKPEEPRKRIKLTLERKPPHGYGIGLAKDRKQEGVFVFSILPGGVADMDGRLAIGDEIKTIDGEDVSRIGGYSRAIELLSKNVATLEVDRKMVPWNHSTEAESSAFGRVPESDLRDLFVVVAGGFGFENFELTILSGYRNLKNLSKRLSLGPPHPCLMSAFSKNLKLMQQMLPILMILQGIL